MLSKPAKSKESLSKTWPIYKRFREIIETVLAKKRERRKKLLMLDNRIYLEIGDLGRRRILGNTTTIQNKEDVEGKLDI